MDFYRDVAEHWGEIGFLYLFLLAGLYWSLTTAAMQVTLSSAIDKDLIPLASQMPELKSVDGKFQIDKPSPYTMKFRDQELFIFDTTGNTQTLTKPGMLITDKEVLYFSGRGYSSGSDSSGSGEAKVLMKASDLTSTVSPVILRQWIEVFRNFFWIGILVGGWFSGTIFLYCLALVYGIIGLIFNAITQAQLKFGQLMRLSAVAITPPLVTEATLKLVAHICNPTGAEIHDMLLKIGGFVASMVYLFLGVNAYKSISTELHTDQSHPPLDS
jgi:hypothetical protein